MNRHLPDESLFELARELLAREAAVLPGAPEDSVFQAFEKVRQPLGTLAGVTGVRVLLSRALTLAKAKCAPLSAISVQQDGSLKGFNALSPQMASEAGLVLLVELLGLLVAFIGKALTMQLIRNVWLELTVSEIAMLEEGEYEPTQ